MQIKGRWGTRGPHSPKGVGIRGSGVMGSGGVSSFKNKQQPTTNTIKSKARVKRARAKEIKIN
ncbi:hypothetical protein CI593_19325 [Fischerella thermalis CCMEE 5194]|nr:hypothetical protein CI593_19325 [Fischerella thermalis CCMEE 5194]